MRKNYKKLLALGSSLVMAGSSITPGIVYADTIVDVPETESVETIVDTPKETEIMEEQNQSEAVQEVGLIDASGFTVVDENISKLHMTKAPATLLFDEQYGVPLKSGSEGTNLPIHNWKQTYNSAWGSNSCYIDLGAEYFISEIAWYDTNGVSDITIQMGTPFDWVDAVQIKTDKYLKWRFTKLNGDEGITTRYLRVITSNADSGLGEIGLYGYKVADANIDETNVRQPVTAPLNLTSGQKIGACGFCDDPFTALAALGNLRDYYNWNWIVAKDGSSFDFNSVVNRDNFYTTLKDMGVTAIPCVQGTAEYFLQEGEDFAAIKNTMPVLDGEDTQNPESYRLHGQFMYNIAARYGSNSDIDTDTLMTKDKVVGMDVLKAVESWNEQNKDWETKDSYFSPYEYAAMLSADWDGDEGAIANAGVKTADSNMLLAMGGTVGAGSKVIDYLDLMKHWFDYNRQDGEFCADIINVHAYITDEESPENSSFREDIRNLAAWIEDNIPQRELWLSEFDVLTDDKVLADVNNHDNEEYAKARAERLLRAFLVGEREGVDISSMFMLRDEWSGVYANSGLTTGKGEWDKKTSWYYVSCASDVLSNADLIDVSETDNLYTYTYKDRETSELIYAVWSPTSNGSSIDGYSLEVGQAEKASSIVPVYGVKEGQKQSLEINNGNVVINVTETPVFVKVSGSDVLPDNYPQSKISIQQIRLGNQHGNINTVFYNNTEIINLADGESMEVTENELDEQFMLSQFYKLFDEQGVDITPATPWVSVDVNPITQWHAQKTSTAKRQSFPYDCIVTFDDYYDLTYIGFYDTYNVGQMEIYNDETGELIYSYGLDTYNRWNLVPMSNIVGKNVNRIRIVKYNSANLNEMAFYGYKSNSKVGVDVEAIPGDIDIDINAGYTRKDVISVSMGESTSSKSSALSAFEALFDEQEKAPVDTEHTISESNPFKTKFGKISGTYPLGCKVNFDGEQTIHTVAIMNEWGDASGSITLADEDGNEIQTLEFNGKNKWHVFHLDESITTSELTVIKNDKATLSEIAFY